MAGRGHICSSGRPHSARVRTVIMLARLHRQRRADRGADRPRSAGEAGRIRRQPFRMGRAAAGTCFRRAGRPRVTFSFLRRAEAFPMTLPSSRGSSAISSVAAISSEMDQSRGPFALVSDDAVDGVCRGSDVRRDRAPDLGDAGRNRPGLSSSKAAAGADGERHRGSDGALWRGPGGAGRGLPSGVTDVWPAERLLAFFASSTAAATRPSRRTACSDG